MFVEKFLSIVDIQNHNIFKKFRFECFLESFKECSKLLKSYL